MRGVVGAGSASRDVHRAGVDRQDQGIRPAPNGGADRADRASLRSARAPGWRGDAGGALLDRHPGRTGLLAFPQPGVISERAERPGKATQSHFKATTKPYTRHRLRRTEPPQSHPKATPRLHQGSTKATPKPHQGHIRAIPKPGQSRTKATWDLGYRSEERRVGKE